MSNDTDTDDTESTEPEQRTFHVTTQRVIEVDFPVDQLDDLAEQTNEPAARAIEQQFRQREMGFVEPTEKLLGVSVVADET